MQELAMSIQRTLVEETCSWLCRLLKLAAKEVGNRALRVQFKISPNTWKEESCHHLTAHKTHLFQLLRLILIPVVVHILCSVQLVFYPVTDKVLSLHHYCKLNLETVWYDGWFLSWSKVSTLAFMLFEVQSRVFCLFPPTPPCLLLFSLLLYVYLKYLRGFHESLWS